MTRLVLIEPPSMIWLKDNLLTFSFSKTDWFGEIIWGAKCKGFQNHKIAKLQISIKSASLSMPKLRTIFQSCSLKYWPFAHEVWRINKTENFETKRSFLAQITPKICWEEGKGEKIHFAKSRGGNEVFRDSHFHPFYVFINIFWTNWARTTRLGLKKTSVNLWYWQWNFFVQNAFI